MHCRRWLCAASGGVQALLRTISRRCIRCLGCCSVSFIVHKSLAKRTLSGRGSLLGADCARVETRLSPHHRLQSLTRLPAMSLVSGPGRAGIGAMPAEMQLFVDKHVRYIQSLDTVRDFSIELHTTAERSPR